MRDDQSDLGFTPLYRSLSVEQRRAVVIFDDGRHYGSYGDESEESGTLPEMFWWQSAQVRNMKFLATACFVAFHTETLDRGPVRSRKWLRPQLPYVAIVNFP